jgi:ABC-type phosphate transport system auxiliary subunit
VIRQPLATLVASCISVGSRLADMSGGEVAATLFIVIGVILVLALMRGMTA